MPVTLSPIVPELHAGSTRVQACQPCSVNHHPDWGTIPEWAYPLRLPLVGWDNTPAIVLIDHTYLLGGNARLHRTRIAMCPRHAEMYLGTEQLTEFLARQKQEQQGVSA